MKRIIVFILVGLVSFGLNAQRDGRGQGRGQGKKPAIKIKGQILDSDNSNPLEFATLSFFSKRDSSLISGGLTDLEGKFIVDTKPGPQYGVVEFIGYENKIIEVPFDRDAMRSGNREIDLGVISISSKSLLIDGVEIRAEKSETQFSLDKRVFNVGQDLANRGGTAEDILDNVPSVTVDIDGAVSLRGSTGVRILIDGKPSGLVGADNANGLRTIPSNLIDQVEVITNPSARYEAEGMAGIINIILKKDKGSGFNGSFDVSAGLPTRAGIGANLNYRKNRLNWFANYGLNYRTNLGGGYSNLERENATGTFYQNQDQDRERGGLTNSIRLGMDFLPSDKETLTGAFLYKVSDENNFATILYSDFVGDLNNKTLETIRTDDEVEDESNLEYSLVYSKEYSSRKHKLDISAQFQDKSETESSDFLERYTAFDGSSTPSDLLQQSANAESENRWVFQLDYKQPIGEFGNVEFGANSSLRNINNDYKVEELVDGIWFDLPGQTNIFNYDENIHAVYGIYGNQYEKFGYQVGLRSEYSDVVTELITTEELNDRDYFNFFPSAFLNYELSEGNSMQVSYSKRIRRPRFWDLNPFFTFSDSRNTFSGNPNLDPELTDSYEVAYIKYFDNLTLNSSVYYRHTNDVIQRILTFNADGTTNRQPENLATNDSYGLEFNVSYSGIEWLRLDGSSNFFRSKTDGTNIDANLLAETITWTSRMTSRFTVWDSDLQIRANYRAPRNTTQGRAKAIASVDIGWSKDLLSKQATLTLSARDVFNSRKRRSETFGEGFYRESEFQWRGRSVNLAFNYRINQKKKRQRQGGGNNEGGGEF